MYTQNPNDKYTYVLSIDIGIKNLALLLLECDEEYSVKDIIWFDLIDITEFCHLDNKSKKECKLSHSKTICDWLAHVFFVHKELFDLCKYMLKEKQPPQGHVSVEQIIFFHYRSKCILVHPRSVHKYFCWGIDIDYEQRKRKSTLILEKALEYTNRTWLVDKFKSLDRKHDISDAYIQAIYFLSKKHREFVFNKKLEDNIKTDTLYYLDKFYFKGDFSFNEEIY